MKKHMIYGLAALVAVNLFGCKKDEPKNSADSGASADDGFIYTGGINEYTQAFEEIFGQIDPTQGWNMGETSRMHINTDRDGHRIGVYAEICNRWYLLAEKVNASKAQDLTVSYPRDIKTVQVVVDYLYAYPGRPDGTIDATGRGNSVIAPETWQNAEPLSWILAASTPGSTGYDLNDFVGRFTLLPDGSVRIQAMATGLVVPLWLHYTDGVTDYVISPKAGDNPDWWVENPRYAVQSIYLDDRIKLEYEWHRWFDSKYGTVSYGNTVNVLDITGANYADGATITLSPEVINSELDITNISVANVLTDEHGNVYAKPIHGFYVTMDTYHTSILPEDKRPFDVVMTVWPMGRPAQMVVIPDVGSDDTPTKYHGWRWPSKGSRVDKTYPHFPDWVADPEEAWYAYTPDGWNDRPSEKDKTGEYLYWGYYPR